MKDYCSICKGHVSVADQMSCRMSECPMGNISLKRAGDLNEVIGRLLRRLEIIQKTTADYVTGLELERVIEEAKNSMGGKK